MSNDAARRVLAAVAMLVCPGLAGPAAFAGAAAAPTAAGAPAVPPVAGPGPGSRLCLEGGRILDPRRRTLALGDLVVDAGVITAVGPGAGADCRGQHLDLTGQVVMPGLVDLHVHAWGNPSPTEDVGDEELGFEAVLALVLKGGVMAVLDLAGSDGSRLAVRDRLRGSPDHAAYYVASALFVRAPRDGAPPPVEAELRQRVRTRAALRPDFIKIVDAGGGVIAPIIDEARKLGFKTVVHITTWADAADAIRAGATAITHLEDEVVLPRELAAAWAGKGILSIPTMAVQCDVATLVAAPKLLDDPLLARLTTPALRAAYRDEAHFTKRARSWAEWQKDGCVPNDFVSLRLLHAAGVGILAGSDTGNLGTFQGFSVHREMELMVQAGLPPFAALAAATTDAARFLGISWGTEVGAPANLIVVSGSPIDDIRNTRKIVRVIHRGHVLDLATGMRPPAPHTH